MTRNPLILTTIALLILGATGGGMYWLGLHRAAPPMADGKATAAPAERKPLYWHDPMVPGQRFDKPGKSPFMDMQLVPVYADEPAAGGGGKDGSDGSDGSGVRISGNMQQNLGIRTAAVVSMPLAATLTAVGTVGYNERDVAVVQARSNGFVERLLVRAMLDPVRKGQPLAEIYVPDWVAAQEEFLAARRIESAAAAGPNLPGGQGALGDIGGVSGLADAARQRMRLAGMSDEQIGLVDKSGKVHPRLTVTAPLGGVVSELSVREGMTVASGTPLFRINGTGTVWVNVDVPENSLARLRPGAGVTARSDALPGTVLNGRIGVILPAIDPATRTLKARAELPNPGGRLVPGMFVTVSLDAAAATRPVLTVPSEAVIQTGTRSVVMVAQEGGHFAPVDVDAGVEINGQTEIRHGLVAGQKVVVSGQFLIDSEASLKGAANRMDAPTAAMATPAPMSASSASSASTAGEKPTPPEPQTSLQTPMQMQMQMQMPMPMQTPPQKSMQKSMQMPMQSPMQMPMSPAGSSK